MRKIEWRVPIRSPVYPFQCRPDLSRGLSGGLRHGDFVQSGGGGDVRLAGQDERKSESVLAELAHDGEGPPVIPLRGKEWVRSDRVGEMASDLLEILKEGSIDIPPGFVITIQGFLRVLASNDLDRYLRPDPCLKESDWVERYRSLAKGLSQAAIPEDLKGAISEALRNLSANQENSRPFILWPSPVRSQAIPIFPFPTLAWSGESLETLWDILRSLWSQVYRRDRFEEARFPGRYPLVTAVVCQREISRGEGDGVQTMDSILPDGRGMVVRRLVPSASLDPSDLKKSLEFHISRICHEGPVLGSDLENGGWSAEKGQRLIQLSLQIENHFKRAQEILWREGPDGQFYPMHSATRIFPMSQRPP